LAFFRSVSGRRSDLVKAAGPTFEQAENRLSLVPFSGTPAGGQDFMRVAMIGSGYIGLVSGPCFADFGHQVTCVDKDAAKIARLRHGEIPLFEPDLDRLVAVNVREPRSISRQISPAQSPMPRRCSSPSARRRVAATAIPT
jgi:hypothetical protein